MKQLITRKIDTPIGEMLAGATAEHGICIFDFCDRRSFDNIQARIITSLAVEMTAGDHPHLQTLEIQINEYFQGQRKAFDIPLYLAGTAFQQTVWNGLQQIEYGHTRSYKQQSQYLGNEKAIRAVARANGENGLAIIIPCHRVVGTDGSLTGYGGGLWRKQWLLEHEQRFAGLHRQVSLFS